ncbi:MAG TPA: hypothetical protein VKU00_03800 [Chthonomonadaceae bacterium]|nr:hypothetical protein [Chthonomonadaceae bacterium]
MPKPHYTPQGGPHLPAWARPAANPAEPATEPTGSRKPAGPSAAPYAGGEVERLRRERASAEQAPPRLLASHPGNASTKMVWVALGAFGAVILFALLALLRHG